MNGKNVCTVILLKDFSWTMENAYTAMKARGIQWWATSVFIVEFRDVSIALMALVPNAMKV